MSQLSSFERLALPQMDAAFNLAFWLVRDQADAEDIVQEAYILACKCFSTFRGEKRRTWLVAIRSP